MSYRVTVQPATEPLTLAEAKLHCRVDGTDEDSLIESLIVAARAHCEAVTHRQFVTATYEMTLDAFPDADIALPCPPLRSVTGITYVDGSGVTRTVSTSVYNVDTVREPGRVTLAYGETWPTTRLEPNAVRVTFAAGYGEPASVPPGIVAAMKLIVGHLYMNREAVNVGNIVNELPMAVDALLGPYSLPEVR